MAAWAQAAGVIIVIGFSFWHANYERNKIKVEEIKSTLSILSSIKEYIDDIGAFVKTKNEDSTPNVELYTIYQIDILKSYGSAVKEIPLMSLRSNIAVKNVILLFKHLELLGVNLELYLDQNKDLMPFSKNRASGSKQDGVDRNRVTRFEVSCGRVIQQIDLASTAIHKISNELTKN
ncbi:hypothetical protein [Chromobacterium haemolyticum]|uniref:hypothetical protein n=1 Tax=Chromobacterium haemolyticum TaxID=394935 RepID=UPI0011300ACA|nr:hypothetical protein [Chromobacterium haemolyticum]